MILDPQTGLTLEDTFKFMRLLVRASKDNLTELKDAIQADYEVPDETLDALENKQELTPNDIRTLARAVGMDYELLMNKDLTPDFQDRFNNAVNNLWNIRKQYRLQPEVQNGL